MFAREVFLLAVFFFVCSQAAVIDRKDPDWVNNLESDQLDDNEIEALSIDDSHTDRDLEHELQDIEAKDATTQNSPPEETITDVLTKVNENHAGTNSVEVTEVDIATPPAEEGGSDKRSALRNLGKIWQDRKVPYIISSDFDKATTDKIKGVMEQYMNKTCLQFFNVAGKTSSVKTYLSIKKLSGCWSFVGRVYDGEQTLSIGEGCEYDGVIIHEIMHALGFYHEQSRSDRDDFVEIMWENIKTGKDGNFKKHTSDTVQTFKTEYDYGSVMHYSRYSFSKNGKATIVPRKTATIGQRNGFSNLDLQEINALYQCNKTGGGLSEWSEWSPCLGSGSSMYKERQRYCFETDRSKCTGVNERGLEFERKSVSCSDPECISKGHWSKWSAWTDCSTKVCTTYGTISRTRACTNPAPKCGGATCPGSDKQTGSCYAGNCLGPDDCEFENESQSTCHWKNSTGYPLDWIRKTGGTPSSNTGPSGDASKGFNGNGHYLYVEASSPAEQGQRARMCSKVFKGPAKKLFTFKYHSYVTFDATLKVIMKNSTGGENELWSTLGLEKNKWLNTTLTISNSVNFEICFEYTRGASWRGDVAVDDLHFKDVDTDECSPNPCQNGGSCTDQVNGYQCTCAAGYTGTNCETNIDDCSPNPCQNGGACTDGVNSYQCKCPAGYTGANCETNVDDCSPNPCKNGGACTDGINSYQCTCAAGYTGADCEQNIDDCSPNPCQNGGACTDGINSYKCTCVAGYTGANCETNVDDCNPNPCKNGGACIDGVNGYQCTCAAGYTGADCGQNVDDCSPNPCQNGGSCADGVNSYQCTCVAGYTGANCETNINDCSPNPCQNGGTCTDGVNGYQCFCDVGYTGTNCETNTDECSPNPCQNGGSCTDQVNGYQCTCAAGYTGTNCETNIDDCSPNPCKNGGTCTDGVNSYQCKCTAGHTGANCETNINDCNPNPCKNGGTCTDGVNGYQCTCVAGYTGADCETNINECLSNPCHNGGNCIDGVNGYKCHCFGGFTGSHCEINVNECNSSPCKNGGTCVDGIHDFTCVCTTGYTGKRCENFNDCSNSPCKNGGTCTDIGNSYQCTCVAGYTGANCETNIDDCSPNPCQNGGACTDRVNSYQCACAAGYTGANCETNVDDCSPNPCQNGGSCADGVNSYKCTCVAGYTGANCETNVNECNPNPCKNGGACIDGVNGYQCTCAAGYTGADCGQNVDDCSPNPCQNGGSCTDGVNSYQCKCIAGYTGTNCETNTDECSPNPCQNGGTCTDGVNSYQCFCANGFTGANCETNVDECSPNPCQNGGTCTDGVNSYQCTCVAGYTGANCGQNIDDCSPNPCQNGGNCTDGVNSYQCTCAAGYTGNNCETNIDDCSPNPCQNGGSCTDQVNSYKCMCVAGYSGPNCETNTDECSPNPCQNGGSCTDQVNGYQCSCAAGYTGTNCETNIDDCSPNRCKNGGSCIDGLNSYQCVCTVGYTGANCQTNVDDCSPNPCQNGGTCTDGVNSYQCTCVAGYTGASCETNIDDCASNPCQNGGTCVDGIHDFSCTCTAGYTGKLCENAIPTTTTAKPTTTKPPVFTDSLSCDFECGMCAWKQETSNDTFDWSRKNGRTPSYYTGPSYDHTTAKNGFYIFSESSWPRQPNHNAILYSPKMQSDGQPRCMDFYYHMYGKGIGSLHITVEHDGKKHEIFKKKGNQGNIWRYGKAKLDVPYGSDFVVRIESIRGSDWKGDTAIDDIRVWKGACSGLNTPSVLACPLERRVQFCDWSQKRDDDGNWRLRRAGGRFYGDAVDAEDDGMSVNMSELKVEDPRRRNRGRNKYNSCSRGPRRALSGKRDSFIYFNGRKAVNKETAVLQSKSISTSEDTCLRFFAFMCGNNIGSLSVDMVNGVTGSRKELKKISGNQKGHWFETEANIPAGSNFKIELTATQGVKARIVIDDLQVSPGKCQFYKNLFSCTFANGNCGFTEADDDDCKWKITNSAKGKALQWSINDCDADSDHYHAHLTKEVNVPQRGGCLTVEYNQNAQSDCKLDVLMEDASRSYSGKRQVSKRDKIYFSRTKNSKYHVAYVTVPPPRGGCPRRKLYVEVDLEESSCERFAITNISWREGICGKR